MFRIVILSLLVCASSLRLQGSDDDFVQDPEKYGIRTTFDSYEDYVKAQDRKTSNVLDLCRSGVDKKAVDDQDMKFLVDYMKDTMHLPFTHKFALTHGTRCGFEQKYFIEALKEKGEKVSVLGTEISPNATDFPYTIVWDFHKVKPEWEGHTDFVYSNALDHSYNPEHAIRQWMKEVAPEGVLILEHNYWHTRHNKDVDLFGTSLEGYKELVKKAGNFKLVDVVKNPYRADAIVKERWRQVGEADKATHYLIVQHA